MGPRAPLAGLFRAGWSFHWKWFPQREPNKFGFIQHRAFTKGGSVSDSNAPEEREGKVHFFYAAVASCDGIGIGLRGPSQAIHWLLGYCWYIRSAFCWWETQGRGTVCRSLTADGSVQLSAVFSGCSVLSKTGQYGIFWVSQGACFT